MARFGELCNASELSANFYHIVVAAAIDVVVVHVAVVAAIFAELDGSSQAVVKVSEPCALSSLFVVVVVVVVIVVVVVVAAVVAEMDRLKLSLG